MATTSWFVSNCPEVLQPLQPLSPGQTASGRHLRQPCPLLTPASVALPWLLPSHASPVRPSCCKLSLPGPAFSLPGLPHAQSSQEPGACPHSAGATWVACHSGSPCSTRSPAPRTVVLTAGLRRASSYLTACPGPLRPQDTEAVTPRLSSLTVSSFRGRNAFLLCASQPKACREPRTDSELRASPSSCSTE